MSRKNNKEDMERSRQAGLEAAWEENARRHAEEAGIEVIMPVRTMKDVNNPQVQAFCRDMLTKGHSWNELRRMLGCGPMHLDNRWRRLKAILVESPLMPNNEEEALEALYNNNEQMIEKLDDLLARVEVRAKELMGKGKVEADLLATQLQVIKTITERNEKKFEHYLNMKKLKVLDKKRQGPSIVYQNNFYMPRPGDNRKEIMERKAAQLAGKVLDIEAEAESDNNE